MATTLQELTALREGWKPQDYSKRERLTEETIAVFSDVHLPYHDEKLLASALERAQDYNANAIVWLGDLMDMPLYSSWGMDDKSTVFTRELRMVERLIRLAANYAPVQYWSSGNHEMRFMRANGLHLGMEQLAGMAGLGDMLADGTLMVSDNPSFEYTPPAGAKWFLTHPSEYSATPLVVPGKVAEIEGKNVLCAHAHHWGMGSSPTGRFTVVESGGLFNPKLVKYVQHRVTTHRRWVPGYVILDYGEPMLFRN